MTVYCQTEAVGASFGPTPHWSLHPHPTLIPASHPTQDLLRPLKSGWSSVIPKDFSQVWRRIPKERGGR